MNLYTKKLYITNNDNILVDINFTITSSTALVGQSGSGKSLTLKSILQLIPSNLKSTFKYESSFDLNHHNIGFIPQNPFTSLSPLTKIKDQFFCNKEQQLHMIKLVNLDLDTLNKFPSQLSGGQLQRVVIAIVLSKTPKLLLLDEPTTALDKDTQQTILKLIKDLQNKLEFLILFVTHDITSIKDICEDIIILKDGYIVESGKTSDVLQNSSNEYTNNLIKSSFNSREFRI
ncbi:MAG: ABC transporter ATP-binding protein [Campylobacteraceae bacterium]|jgi:peptide/nickel transport system ATP-binding protein|nr:ABC transporter ATP-binding protein [Campylobacteraceae bacterium]MBT3882549.1 ABC transporter ATP-binding protein [Campylobacteraceae bacterium]MBT4030854.1 ABC transporter ATP-binding protein [Campylobacteraceae bacterium]MBT4179084.1 ABC transporter ATP-binding protein [Campylobacteraceae bacterium]MBT4572490.1 ABC transporter ATP-binding protein [Campylobacteraceae bacterium]